MYLSILSILDFLSITIMKSVTLLILILIPASVIAHSAMTIPRPRNAIDSDTKPWGGDVPHPLPFEPWCPFPSKDAAGRDDRNLTGANGQGMPPPPHQMILCSTACFWFSNGCDIGSSKCDGLTGQKIPCCNAKFLFKGALFVLRLWEIDCFGG